MLLLLDLSSGADFHDIGIEDAFIKPELLLLVEEVDIAELLVIDLVQQTYPSADI